MEIARKFNNLFTARTSEPFYSIKYIESTVQICNCTNWCDYITYKVVGCCESNWSHCRRLQMFELLFSCTLSVGKSIMLMLCWQSVAKIRVRFARLRLCSIKRGTTTLFSIAVESRWHNFNRHVEQIKQFQFSKDQTTIGLYLDFPRCEFDQCRR